MSGIFMEYGEARKIALAMAADPDMEPEAVLERAERYYQFLIGNAPGTNS